jgi:hypothetical protein
VEGLLKAVRSGARVDLTIGVIRADGSGQRVGTVTVAAR